MWKSSALLLALALSLSADAIEHLSDMGHVNWSQGKAYAKGFGVPNPQLSEAAQIFGARRAAVVNARRNLLEIIKGVRIDSETVIVDGMLESERVTSHVEGSIKGSLPVQSRILGDNSAEVTVALSLSGEIMDAVTPGGERAAAWIPDYYLAALETESTDAILKTILKRLDSLETNVYGGEFRVEETGPTGVIIDARGSHFIPSLSPKIFRAGGVEIYPAKLMARDDIVSQFAALFSTSVEEARDHPRVGGYPLVLKALRTYGKWRHTLVLGKKHSATLLKYKDSEALKSGRVLIVIDR